MKRVESHAAFGGQQTVWEHASEATGTTMRFAVYEPPAARKGPCRTLFWLSGLTCTEQNFITKSGFHRYAAEHDLVVVAPDTSPRGDGVADVEAWDMGQGAGFYVDATEKPWAPHFSMWSYVTDELPRLVVSEFPVAPERIGVSGHSMGGHGALIVALRNPTRFRTASAFAPICAPSDCPWGQKAFGGYLGEDRAKWAAYDATRLIEARGWDGELLVDQGADDPFYKDGQLLPEKLEAACRDAGVALEVRRHPGYDHGYYFVSTFIGDHIAWHADRL